MCLFEGLLKVKIAHFQLPSASQKRACLSSLINFEVMLYISILIFLSPGSFFKSAICYQYSISKHIDRHVFAAVERKKNSSPETFEDSRLNTPF